MRSWRLATALLCLVSGTLFWLARPEGDAHPERFMPRETLGLLLVNRAPENLDFLDRTQLAATLGLSAQSVRQRFDQPLVRELSLLFHSDVEQAWFCLHRLEPRPSGTWRIHFSALLRPARGRLGPLQSGLKETVVKFFQHPRLHQGGRVSVIQGATPGQIFYLMRRDPFLFVSNSPRGWRQMMQVLSGSAKALSSLPSFRFLTSELPVDSDLFLYLNLASIFPLLPEFAYTLSWDGNALTEAYREVP